MKLAFMIHSYGGFQVGVPTTNETYIEDVPTTHETYIADIPDNILPAEVREQLAGNNHNTEMSISIVKEVHK